MIKMCLPLSPMQTRREDMDRMVAACVRTSPRQPAWCNGYGFAEKSGVSASVKTSAADSDTPKAYFFQYKKSPLAGGGRSGVRSGACALSARHSSDLSREQISQEVWEYIECFRRDGRHIHGAGKDGRLEFVKVVES